MLRIAGPEFERKREADRVFVEKTDPVGLSAEMIVRIAGEQGLSVRVINDDSGSKAPTADLRANRINVETRLGIVRRVDAVH